MEVDRYARLAALFDEAVELDTAGRHVLLERLRVQDEALAIELVALLAADSAPQHLIDAPLKLAIDVDQDGSATVAGDAFGAYRLVRELGHGGMGVVWLAERDDDQVRQTVALKLIRPGLDSTLARRRFRRERAILASLEHPYIARLLDAGIEADGRPWFAMEHVAGAPITEYANTHALSVHERLRLFVNICRAVQFAHGRLVVHRDLKPSNILIDAHGTPKLLDFGIARLLAENGESGEATEPTLFGAGATPDYAAPEQLRGEAPTVASDGFALGVVLYELLTGSRPWPRGQRRGLAADVTAPPASQAAPAGSRRRALRGDLDTILAKALAADAVARYVSADAFADDIERHLAGHPVRAQRGSRLYRSGKFVRRHAAGVAAVIAVALALIIGTGVAAWQAQLAQRQAQRAESVRTFLTDLFAIADPNLTHGREVTARELLREGARRTALRPGSDPLLAAEINSVVGNLARRIGDYASAERRLRAAEAVLARNPASEPQRLAQVRIDLANTVRLNGDPRAARGILERLIADPLTDDSQLRASAFAGLAQTLADLNDAKAGEDSAQRALALDLASAGPASEAVARDHNVLAELAYARLDFASAVTRYREVLDTQRALHGEAHTAVAQAHQDLGVALAGAGDLDEAARELQTAHTSFVDLLGPQHPAVASVLVNWGGALRQAGRLDDAEPKYRQALAIDQEVLGPEHPETLRSLNSLAALLTQRGRDVEATAMFERVLAGYRHTLGESNGQLAPVLISLAGLAFRSGDYERSAERYRQAIAIADATYGMDNPRSDVARRGLGYTLAMAGDPAAGLPLLREALARHLKRYDEHHPEVIVFRSSLAQVLAAAGKLDEAAAIARIALAAAQAALPATHPFRAHAVMVSARIEMMQGCADAAAQTLATLDPATAVAYAPYFEAEYAWLALRIQAAKDGAAAQRELARRGPVLLARLPPLLRDMPAIINTRCPQSASNAAARTIDSA